MAPKPLRRAQRSPEAKAWQHFYSTTQWIARRKHQLTKHPLCARCLVRGHITAATVAHHTTPHKGNWDLFLHGDLASSCKPCHDAIEQSVERRGYDCSIDSDGWPIDPKHPANKKPGGA